MQRKKKSGQNTLVIGENDKKNPVFIQEENRLKHLMVIGMKGTGKSTRVLPTLAKQDIEDKKVGLTVITAQKDTALLLYALAKRAGRDIVLIKPSLTDSGKFLLQKSRYDSEEMKSDVLDYQKAIQKKQVVIVDMESIRHHQQAIRGVAYLLESLKESMVKENEGEPTKHYLYIDDAHKYIPFAKDILYEGSAYGVGCTLFLDSRSQLASPEEQAVIDTTVHSIILMNGLTLEDVDYFVKHIYEKQAPYLRNRPGKEFVYSTLSKEDRRTTGSGDFTFLPEELLQSLRMSIPRYRGGIEREQVGVEQKPVLAIEVTSSMQPEKMPETAPEKEKSLVPKVAMPAPTKALVIKPKRDRVTAMAETHSKKHVVILDDLFDDNDEF